MIDKELGLPETHFLFDRKQCTIVFNYHKQQDEANLSFCQLNKNENILWQIMNICYKRNIQSILVEGGSLTIQSFIDINLWDEAAIFTHKEMKIKEGIRSPQLRMEN